MDPLVALICHCLLPLVRINTSQCVVCMSGFTLVELCICLILIPYL